MVWALWALVALAALSDGFRLFVSTSQLPGVVMAGSRINELCSEAFSHVDGVFAVGIRHRADPLNLTAFMPHFRGMDYGAIMAWGQMAAFHPKGQLLAIHNRMRLPAQARGGTLPYMYDRRQPGKTLNTTQLAYMKASGASPLFVNAQLYTDGAWKAALGSDWCRGVIIETPAGALTRRDEHQKLKIARAAFSAGKEVLFMFQPMTSDYRLGVAEGLDAILHSLTHAQLDALGIIVAADGAARVEGFQFLPAADAAGAEASTFTGALLYLGRRKRAHAPPMGPPAPEERGA